MTKTGVDFEKLRAELDLNNNDDMGHYACAVRSEFYALGGFATEEASKFFEEATRHLTPEQELRRQALMRRRRGGEVASH